MRTLWALWAIVMLFLGIVLTTHSEFIDALALDRSLLLWSGVMAVIFGPLVWAAARDTKEYEDEERKKKEGQ